MLTSTKYDPCMQMMTSKTEMLSLSSSKNHSAEAFPHALNSEDATDLLFFFLTNKISPLQNVPSRPLPSYPLTFYTHTPLSI